MPGIPSPSRTEVVETPWNRIRWVGLGMLAGLAAVYAIRLLLFGLEHIRPTGESAALGAVASIFAGGAAFAALYVPLARRCPRLLRAVAGNGWAVLGLTFLALKGVSLLAR
jgi:hypothetical protein